jgi:hypothetical protein
MGVGYSHLSSCDNGANSNHDDFTRECLSIIHSVIKLTIDQAYWNLDGFKNPVTPLTSNHTLHMPYAGQRVGTDTILIPDGTLIPNTKGGVHDFWSAPKQLGSSLDDPDLLGACGFNCSGYGNSLFLGYRS